MVITEISIIHHVCIVLLLLWLLTSYNCCHPVAYFVSLIYLYQVNERYSMRLRKRLQFEERKTANQRRVLADSETVRWLNHAVEIMWPICIENIVSQRIFLKIIPWFLEKYKPWTVKRATVQHLYLGRTPPLFTDIRVLRESTDDDHLVLELGLNFLTADDMSAVLSAKLRKRLGFGMMTKMHLTGMHVEGKVLVGVKFLRSWPFIGRLRVCFAEPPYFQMTVKPIFHHGLDVTEIPGIAGWLDKLLAIAFEETLVEPNMLVVDLEKFVAPQPENWFSVDVKEPVGYANVEVIEAAELKPSDLNGLADPYVKGHLGPYRFRSQIQKKTLTPKWLEEFKIPICSWDSENLIEIEVRDKDRFVDDILGNCSVNICDIRDGQRHDMWLPLEDIKMGRLHLAVTIVEPNGKGKEKMTEKVNPEGEKPNSVQGDQGAAVASKSQKVADTFEPIDVEGQDDTGIWVQHPGSETAQAWEPRKGKSRHIDNEILSVDTPRSSSQSLLNDDSSSDDENKSSHRSKLGNFVHKGFRKIFHKHPKGVDESNSFNEPPPSPHANVKPVHVKRVGINLVMNEGLSEPSSDKSLKPDGSLSNDGSGADNTGKHDVKSKAKNMLKNAGKSARQLKQALSKKGSSKFAGCSEDGVPQESEPTSDDEDSVSSSMYDASLEGVPLSPSLLSRGDNLFRDSMERDKAVDEVTEVPIAETSVNADEPNINKVDSFKGNSNEPPNESLKHEFNVDS